MGTRAITPPTEEEEAREANAPLAQSAVLSAAPRPVSRFERRLKWLAPDMRVKRYLILIPLGIFFVLLGVAVFLYLNYIKYTDILYNLLLSTTGIRLEDPWVYRPLGIVFVGLGLWIILYALIAVNRSIVSAVAPDSLSDLPDVIRRNRALSQGAKIVVIGGGTGLSTLLRGLKTYTSNLTAVVAMSDDGGSSGQLKRQLPGGVLPPGDIRNCLVALADAEPIMQKLFQYRFQTVNDGDGLSGHNFGNLLIAAMADITGDFEEAVAQTAKVLAIRGRVLPSTVEPVSLVGTMADGATVHGESAIAKDPRAIERISLLPEHPHPVPEVLAALLAADIIVMGPGSVFTSVVPNLLVPEIADAVQKSKASLKVYVCNVMTQRGETDDYSASAHVKQVESHAGRRVFDYVMVNTTRPTDETLARYAVAGAQFVEPDLEAIQDLGYAPVKGKYMSETAVVRHDSEQLAHDLLELFRQVAPGARFR
ncbi:MAG: uridine diphosphate-N-acetylglucosamine-binding protein YvcK [Armatimonadetes bacterium]|nr:uridine diphosphate-N-acetylglucosamine-binding protein YvcK [Armatimonadota bacterium]